ncbi:hypothetical protein L6452_25698 [Arctium lappa]|uniref:Uncharacterized protein n=1 Tax=Arctium lappa TaxID=4217 RepID=A0ACB9ABD1_ARCLA|nr:hypothetical protein L6452_25698 [Arctium lappa]
MLKCLVNNFWLVFLSETRNSFVEYAVQYDVAAAYATFDDAKKDVLQKQLLLVEQVLILQFLAAMTSIPTGSADDDDGGLDLCPHEKSSRRANATAPILGSSVFDLDLKMDLDLGNYERFLDIKLTRDHNITTGKIYQGTSNLCHILKFLDNSLIVLLLRIFPCFVNLPLDKFHTALARALQVLENVIIQESSQGSPVLTPAEVLIGIHDIDPEKDGIPLKKVIDACNACFLQQQIFSQQVLAKLPVYAFRVPEDLFEIVFCRH